MDKTSQKTPAQPVRVIIKSETFEQRYQEQSEHFIVATCENKAFAPRQLRSTIKVIRRLR